MAVLLASHCVGYHGLETPTQLCVDVLVHCTCLRGYLPPPSPFLLYQIDFDESASQNRFTVKPGVDPELDESEHCQSTNHQETLCCAVLWCAVLWCGVVWCAVLCVLWCALHMHICTCAHTLHMHNLLVRMYLAFFLREEDL